MQMELRVLEACSFDYRINNEVHIDEFIVKIGRELSFSYEVCRLAWLIAFDVLKLELLITVPPHTISLAVLKLACELLNESKWPNVRYNLFETESASFHEAYFDILNFYINVFDACNLKDHKAVQKLDLKIETFIEIKKNAGLESGLKTNVLLLDKDDYVSKERNFSVKERRYVLNKECLQEELASNKKRPISELD
ncbi:RNA polymerase II C-terminal domain kinase beta subunit [Kluyveromyces marxianus]|nr:RNA polymerase II C-terminal domain kinase beta subunit [Kluyveromyces marxianus]